VTPTRLLEGKRIGLTVRQSKTEQVGNASTDALDEGMREHLEHHGAEVVAYNENEAAGGRGVSGRDITKRDEFLQQLEDVKRTPGDPRRLDGIGGWDVKRLTRDESGKDSGTIYRVLVKHRALLVTIDRVYRLWLDTDHDAYRLECLKAGWDIRSINQTFWRGLFQTALSEPIARGVPVLGYNKRGEVIPDPKAPGGVRVEPIIQKHPGQRELMADLVALLETAGSQGEIAARMWARWGAELDAHDRQRHKDMAGGWHAGRVAAILENPKYWGEWTFGAACDRLNPLWDIARRREQFEEEGKFRHVLDGVTACPCGHDHAGIGSLAYWTREQARAWRERLCPSDPARPRRRHRGGTYQHGLQAVLACAACGRPMIGTGRHGYVCAGRNTRACREPQQLAEGAARRELRKLLPEALERGRAAIERAVRLEDAAKAPRKRTLQKKRRELGAVQETMRGILALAGKVAQTSPTTKAEYDRLVAQEAALLGEIARLERGERVAAETLAQLTGRMDDLGGPLAWFDRLGREEEGPALQAHVYQLLLAGVRFAGAGRGAGREYRLKGEPRHLLEEQAAAAEAATREGLGDTTISAPPRWSIPAYVPIPLARSLGDLAALLKRAA
jgi:hypothetical protein